MAAVGVFVDGAELEGLRRGGQFIGVVFDEPLDNFGVVGGVKSVGMQGLLVGRHNLCMYVWTIDVDVGNSITSETCEGLL
jgi:hypothetical protein